MSLAGEIDALGQCYPPSTSVSKLSRQTAHPRGVALPSFLTPMPNPRGTRRLAETSGKGDDQAVRLEVSCIAFHPLSMHLGAFMHAGKPIVS